MVCRPFIWPLREAIGMLSGAFFSTRMLIGRRETDWGIRPFYVQHRISKRISWIFWHLSIMLRLCRRMLVEHARASMLLLWILEIFITEITSTGRLFTNCSTHATPPIHTNLRLQYC